MIFLKMKVGGNNLTNICRLLFSISRNTENDSYFLENDIVGKYVNLSSFHSLILQHFNVSYEI